VEIEQSSGQPFTFSGVARYASVRFPRLLGVALLFALLPAAIIAWMAARCWAPVITDAINQLPEAARIEGGTLQVNERESRLLGANQFLAIQLSLGDSTAEAAPVDVVLELGRYEMISSSLFGQLAVPYPESWTISLDRGAWVPFWGAWKPALIGAFAVATVLKLVASWLVMALLYAPIVLFIGSLARRELTFPGAWRLSVAAQWPASLLMCFALALYATGEIGLLFVIIMFFAHFLPTFLNILIAPIFLPRANVALKKANPFSNKKGRAKTGKNPFRKGADD
jgi:hypothetical protein